MPIPAETSKHLEDVTTQLKKIVQDARLPRLRRGTLLQIVADLERIVASSQDEPSIPDEPPTVEVPQPGGYQGSHAVRAREVLTPEQIQALEAARLLVIETSDFGSLLDQPSRLQRELARVVRAQAGERRRLYEQGWREALLLVRTQLRQAKPQFKEEIPS